MAKTLSLKTESIRVLSDSELDGANGGVKSVFKWTGPINNPFETSVHGPVAQPTSSVFHPRPVKKNPIKNPFETHVSSAKPR